MSILTYLNWQKELTVLYSRTDPNYIKTSLLRMVLGRPLVKVRKIDNNDSWSKYYFLDILWLFLVRLGWVKVRRPPQG